MVLDPLKQTGSPSASSASTDAFDVDAHVDGPFAVGTVVWQRAPGEYVCTIAAKATYALENDLCALLDEPDAIQSADDHWDDDPSKSVRIPSDLALFKKTYDIVIVGHAHAPHERPVQDLVVRVVVGSVDKCVDARVAARATKDGLIERGPGVLRMPLRYEAAAGGADTENPVGIDPTALDLATQRYRLPQLLPHNHVVAGGQHVPPVGLGPIAESWPQRASMMRPQDMAWLKRPARSPMPVGFDPRFFSVAPLDQRTAEPFRDDERLILECLHPKQARIVTNLAGIRPKLRASPSFAEVSPFVADTLLIDGDRGVVTLTFRALAVLARAPAMRARMLAAPSGESTLNLPVVEVTNDGEITPGIALPFIENAIRAAAPSRSPDAALPFRATTPPELARPELGLTQALPAMVGPPAAPSSPPPPLAATPAVAPAAAPVVTAAPPSVPPPHPSAPPPAPSGRGQTIGEMRAGAALSMPAIQSDVRRASGLPPVTPARPSPDPSDPPARPSAAPGLLPSPLGAALAPTAAPATTKPPFAGLVAPAPPASKPDRPMPSEPGPRVLSLPSVSSPMGSARAASDAAAETDGRRAEPTKAVLPDARTATPMVPRRVMVDLLHFEPSVPRRLRRSKAHASVLAEFSPPRALRRGDERDAEIEQERDERARLDVLRMLSCGSELDLPAVRQATEIAISDPNDLEIPMFLVAGELRPSYDDVESLRAAVRAAQPLAANDKRLAATIAVANELCGEGGAAQPETLNALYKQIESATLQTNLPPRYLADAVERSVLDQRSYKKRTVLGSPRIRADFVFSAGQTLPAYIPEGTGAMLPLLPSFPCVALVELRPREDVLEQNPDALVIVALGRVVRRART